MEDGLGEQLLELTVSETVVVKFLISLTFGDQKYVPFRVLSRMQIYGFFVNWGFVPPKISAILMAFSVILSDGVGRGDSERGRVVVRL